MSELERDVISQNGYFQMEYEMPFCNHKEHMSDANLGFAKGVTFDGVPFEAELSQYKKCKTLTVMIPAIFDSNPIAEDEVEVGEKSSNVLGFQRDIEGYSESILDIGMVDEGQEDSLDVISRYVDFLVERKVFSFSSDVYNGSVFYRVDALGNDLTMVEVTMEDEEGVWAYTDLKFTDERKGRNFLKIIK